MKIAVLCGPRQFEIIDEPLPEIQPDELLVRGGLRRVRLRAGAVDGQDSRYRVPALPGARAAS